MKIGAIDAIATSLAGRPRLLVKVTGEDGTVGWGEAGLTGREEAVASVVSASASALRGRSVHDANWIATTIQQAVYMEGGRVASAALAAIDIALLDLRGKLLGLPAYDLLGGRVRRAVPLFDTIPVGETDAVIAQALSRRDEGWSALRLMVCRPGEADGTLFDPQREAVALAELCSGLRRAVGPEVLLGIDLHHRFSPPEYARFAERLPAGSLDFVEEPIRAWSVAAYRALRYQGWPRLAIGEELTSLAEFAPFIEAGVIDYARLDLCLAGGTTQGQKIAAFAESRHIPLMPHNPLSPIGLAANLHFGLATLHFSYLEVQRLNDESKELDEVFRSRPRIGKGDAVPLDAPGLGIDVDEDLLPAASAWQAPQLLDPAGGPVPW